MDELHIGIIFPFFSLMELLSNPSSTLLPYPTTIIPTSGSVGISLVPKHTPRGGNTPILARVPLFTRAEQNLQSATNGY